MKSIIRHIPLLVIILTFPTIGQWMNIPIGETVYWWLTDILLLAGFWAYRKSKNAILMPKIIKWWLIWVCVSFVHGMLLAETYWDWKTLIMLGMVYIMGLSVPYFSVPANISKISSKWVRFGIVAFWFLLPFMQLECPGKFLFPFAFFVMFWPFMPRKWKLLVIVFALLVFVYGTLGARSTAIRFAMGFAFSLLFLFNKRIKASWIKILCIIGLAIPFVLFGLGISGIFNVWSISDNTGISEYNVKNSYDDTEEENLTADTRTFLYVETLTSAINNDYYICGHSLARGYESAAFGSGDLSKRGERADTEVAILNVFTHLGLIGFALYFAVFTGAIFSVFKKSRNKFLYIISLYVVFRWCFSWMEDFTRFDLNNLYFWITISMCYSPYFLNMTDREIKQWAGNILTGKHV